MRGTVGALPLSNRKNCQRRRGDGHRPSGRVGLDSVTAKEGRCQASPGLCPKPEENKFQMLPQKTPEPTCSEERHFTERM